MRPDPSLQPTVIVLDRDSVEIPDDPLLALRAAGVAQGFQSLPPGRQNFIIRRLDVAVKPETRDRRIQEVVRAAPQRRENPSEQPWAIVQPRSAA